MIRFIIDTTSSKADVYGNRYHFATITSTKTGKTLNLKSVGGERNAVGLVMRLLSLQWDEVHTSEQEVMIRDYNRMDKYLSGIYEHQLTVEMLEALEVPRREAHWDQAVRQHEKSVQMVEEE